MSFYSYHKIPSIYNRDMGGTKMLKVGIYSSATLKSLSGIDWIGSEKFDGTNVGITWDGYNVSFQGRTERAVFSAVQYKFLEETFKSEEVEQIFEQFFGERPVVLLGELIGKGIQKAGQYYCPDGLKFIAFDLLLTAHGDTPEVWAPQGYLATVCEALNVKISPVVFKGCLIDAVAYVNNLPSSTIAPIVMEGLVMRPTIELRDNQGKRIICKIKAQDFKSKREIQEMNIKYQEALI